MASKVPALSLQQVVDEVGVYPPEAFQFVEQGVTYAAEKHHGMLDPDSPRRHITGADLCFGLRELAWANWGLMSRVVLERWNITSTLDFGRIVFALVRSHRLRKTKRDRLSDFRRVYDFKTGLEDEYKISAVPEPDPLRQAGKKA